MKVPAGQLKLLPPVADVMGLINTFGDPSWHPFRNLILENEVSAVSPTCDRIDKILEMMTERMRAQIALRFPAPTGVNQDLTFWIYEHSFGIRFYVYEDSGMIGGSHPYFACMYQPMDDIKNDLLPEKLVSALKYQALFDLAQLLWRYL